MVRARRSSSRKSRRDPKYCSGVKCRGLRAGARGFRLRTRLEREARLALASQKTSATRRVTAIEIGYSSVRAVEVESRGPEARILKRGSSPLQEEVLDNLPAQRGALTQGIRAALSQAGITSKQVVAAIPRRLVTVKTARLPQAPPEQIAGMVRFEAQQYIPFQIEDVVLGHQIVSDEGDDMTSVMIVAARRTLVDEILAAFDSAGIEVTRLTVSSFGLAEHARSSIAPQAVVEIEPRELDMVVVGDGKLLFSRSASLSESADSASAPRALSNEVARSIAAYDNEFRGRPVTSLLVGGPSATTALSDESFRSLIDVPLDRLNGRLLPTNDPDAIAYATAAGVALTDDPSAVCRINLIPASRTERKENARRRVQALVAVAVLALVLFFAYEAFSASMENQAKERREARRMNDRLDKAKKAHERVKKEHDEVVNTFETVSGGLARDLPAVGAIKAVSDSVPKGGGTFLTQLNFERNGNVSIHGNAKTESAVTEMVTSLQATGMFSSVRLGYMGETQSTELSAAPASTEPNAENAPERVVTTTTSFIITAKLPDLRPVEKNATKSATRRQADEEKP